MGFGSVFFFFFFFFKEGGRTSRGGFWHRLSPSARNLYSKVIDNIRSVIFIPERNHNKKVGFKGGLEGVEGEGVHDVLDFTDRKLIIWH